MSKRKDKSNKRSLPSLHILVVDDEPTIVECLGEGLILTGHTVVVASDGETALEQAMAADFDLVITDLKMPRMGGLELARILVERRPEMSGRIIFMTGDTGELAATRKSHPEDVRCLAKPFGIDEMLRELETWWSGRRELAAVQKV